MLIKDWVNEGMYEDTSDGTVTHIRLRAWQFYREKIGGNFIFKLLGITGRIHKIFVEIFGEEIWF